MQLKSIIASYSGAYFAIQQYLTDDVLAVIAAIARSPRHTGEIAPDLLTELVEMHVLVEQDGLVRLNTAVFLQDDIELIVNTISPFAGELAAQVKERGSAFQHAPAEVTVFLAGIIALVQGVGMRLSQGGLNIWEWKDYPGKYARSKVDFDEMCPAYEAIGPDYLNKTVLQGGRYTAAFIGPRGDNFESYTFTGASDRGKGYFRHLNRYLVDAFAMLVSGEIQHEALRAAAEAANIYKGGRPRTAVIDNASIQKYGDAIQGIIEVVSSYYAEKQPVLDQLLRLTTSGSQGVPPTNMYMNLWRYIRKLTAKALYANRFFTDSIPEEGCLTVFYENDVQLIRQLLL